MLAAFVGLVVCSNIGNAVAVRWANTNPEGLLLLSSRVRHLLLVAGNIDFWSYATIASLRLGAAFLVCYLAGRAFGRTVLVWFGRYLGVPSDQIHSMFQMFHRAEWFVIPFFVGSNIVAAISGISRTSARRLAVLLPIGLAVRVVFWWIIARIADDQVDSVLDFLAKYQRPALIASVVLTIVFVLFNLRRGRNFQL
jgi:membrane protein DedA with SNARE-associated domain